MELSLKPFHKNLFPLGGILIKDPSVKTWLHEIQKMHFNFGDITIYPIPGNTANTIWGCLLVIHRPFDVHNIGKHEACQKIADHIFIPEKSFLFPPVTATEIQSLFQSGIHVMHPDFGLVELTEELQTAHLLSQPVMRSYFVARPARSVFMPQRIRSFQVKPIDAEDMLKHMEDKIFPKHEEMKDESLNLLEKGKLFLYRALFRSTKKEGETGISGSEKTGLWAKLESYLNSVSGKENTWSQNMQNDFENLEKRNQKALDKLLDLLKNNPDEALKYAIPIDENGSGRGGSNAAFDLSRRWFDLGLFGNSNNYGSGGGSIDLGDEVHELRRQYNETARKLIENNQHHKAAFIYMKLLKDHHLAASTLESGAHYQEAATIYLKYVQNKNKAAECYEKGNMTTEAITLYKELNMNEKVGDLYVDINKRKEANVYFEKVVDEYKLNQQFVKASLVYKNKMNNSQGGQALLLEGWRSSKDQSNCLQNYFANIDDLKTLKKEIESIYTNDLTDQNSTAFLQVIQREYNKKNELSESIKEMAYEVIAAQIQKNPSIVSEMKEFNRGDKQLTKDTLRFKLGKK
ncbi:MAG: hypothetical protein V4580_09960 [Bacteroidota bacterium]